jgi:hypothetical protein
MRRAADMMNDTTKKQMGDAGEMLLAAELTLHAIPCFIVPSNWPRYDIVAQHPTPWTATHLRKDAHLRQKWQFCWLSQ